MPKKTADTLANDKSIPSEQLEAAVRALAAELVAAREEGHPVPFLTYRNKTIFQTSIAMRLGNRWKRY